MVVLALPFGVLQKTDFSDSHFALLHTGSCNVLYRSHLVSPEFDLRRHDDLLLISFGVNGVSLEVDLLQLLQNNLLVGLGGIVASFRPGSLLVPNHSLRFLRLLPIALGLLPIEHHLLWFTPSHRRADGAFARMLALNRNLLVAVHRWRFRSSFRLQFHGGAALLLKSLPLDYSVLHL